MTLPRGATIHYHASAREIEYSKRDALCSKTQKLRTTTNNPELVTCSRCTKAFLAEHFEGIATDAKERDR